MPTNTLKIPFINPLQFYKETPDEDDRFRSRDFDDYGLDDTILPWEERVCWRQPWQLSDVIHLQVQSTYGPVKLLLYRASDDALIDTTILSQGAANFNDPTLFLYECDVDLSGYPEGRYYYKLTFASPVVLTLRTDILEFSENCENSLLLEYEHNQFREDMIFETGIRPGIRIPAVKKFKNPASKDTLFEDQVLNIEILRSDAYRIWTLHIGGAEGVPDFIADKLNRILGCNTVLIDGKQYTKADGATLQPKELENYPLRGWNMDLREKTNRASRIYEDEIAVNGQVAALVSVDSKGFGADTGGNETIIVDVD